MAMILRRSLVVIMSLVALAAIAPVAVAQEKDAKSDAAAKKVRAETLASALSLPCGVAVQPASNDLFFCDIATGNVLRLAAGRPGQPAVAISGFPRGAAEARNSMSLAFLGPNMLVAGQQAGDAPLKLSVFGLPVDAKPIKIDDARQTLELKLTKAAEAQQAERVPSSVVALTAMPNAAFTNSVLQGTSSWLYRADLNGTKLQEPAELVRGKSTGTTPPATAMAISKRGEIVVAQSAAGEEQYSRLAFYNPRTGKRLLSERVPLNMILGLAYASSDDRNERLYAIDFGRSDGTGGGLYRLDAIWKGDQLTIEPTKVFDLDRPTSLCARPNEGFYVSVLGDTRATDKQPASILRLLGEF